MFNPLSWWGIWRYAGILAGRCGTAEVAESSTPKSVGSRKRETVGLGWAFETSKSPPLPPRPVTHFYKATPTHPSLVVPLPDG